MARQQGFNIRDNGEVIPPVHNQVFDGMVWHPSMNRLCAKLVCNESALKFVIRIYLVFVLIHFFKQFYQFIMNVMWHIVFYGENVWCVVVCMISSTILIIQ